MNQSPLPTVVSMRESSTDATMIHRGKEHTPTHYYLVHKIINQCHSLSGRKGLGEQICQVILCVILRQLA